MPGIPPRQLALYGLGLLAVVLLGAWYLAHAGPAAAPAAAAPAGAARDQVLQVESGGGGGALTVHVAGAVRRPGVFRMRTGARVDDAVRRAGGARRRADLSALNLAAKLEDGRQVLVPARVSMPAAGAAGAAAAAAATTPGGPAVPLNLNTATPEQLDELDGIGPATAQQIIDFRQAHGGFGSLEELAQVPGIGPKRLAGLREQVRL